jgi:3-oxoacyl-[acyl-carrier protein] reductase
MHDAGSLQGKRVIVTGASRGIGRAIATACARSGATVGVNFNRSEPEARDLAERLGASAMLLKFDVGDPAAVTEAFESFVGRTGGLDVLVNNAGIIRPALLVSAANGDIADVVRTNLVGTISCTRAALPTMIGQRRGVILNVSSVAAERPWKGQTVYAATKGAIEAFTRAVSVEYGRKGIACVCISPGPVDTGMFAATRALAGGDVLDRTPWKRFATPEEVADLALHTIDGGFASR